MQPGDSRIDLHARLHGAMQEWLAQPLHDLFDELDTRLFDLAERSISGTTQHVYFDALRQLRLARVDVETRFLQSADQALQSLPKDDIRAKTAARGTLELLDKGEQEETLSLEQQTLSVSEQVAPALATLLARLAHLAAQPPPADPLTSALSPRGLGRAFRNALQGVDIAIEIRLIALGLFGQHILRALEPMYARLNTLLREAGILPDLVETAPAHPLLERVPMPRPNTPRRVPEVGDSAAASPPAPSARTTVRPTPGTTPDGNADRIGELHHLMRVTRPAAASPSEQQSADANGIFPQPPALAASALDAALDDLWTYDEEPLAFKSKLLDKARTIARNEEARLTSDDEDVIDLIGLLFARIRTDPELPAPMQAMLARLHVPFLRTALKEPQLLRAASHPARELLDELGEVAVGWCESADPGGIVLKQVAVTVERLASHHQSEQPIEYARAITDLHQQLDAGRRRAEVAEQRTIEAVIGRERLALARNRIATLIQQRLGQFEPTPWVRQLVRGPWAHHLALVWLRSNENSPMFQQALHFVDELLWADDPSNGQGEHERLLKARSELPVQLRAGLEGVTLHDSEIAALVRRLETFLDAQVQANEPPDFAYESDPRLVQADFSVQWKDAISEDQPAPERIDPTLLARLRTLSPGTWFEFSEHGREESERAKLCWTSPYTGKLLFVNRNGARLRETGSEALARELEDGLVRLLDGNRLLERSLRNLIDQLRTNMRELDLARSS